MMTGKYIFLNAKKHSILILKNAYNCKHKRKKNKHNT